VFRHRLPEPASRPREPQFFLQLWARPMEPETLVSGIPNTLPPQNQKECWSLAASEFALVST
jgi:hypothetical protein